MRYYDPEIKVLSSLYDLLAAVVDGFPDKDLDTYTKKQRQYLINNLINFTEENTGMLSPEINDLIYPYPEWSFDKLRETLKSANKQYIDLTRERRDEWLAFADRFDELTKNALVRSIDNCLLFDLFFLKDRKTGDILLTNEYTSSYRQLIHLENPIISDNYDTDNFETTEAEIDMLNDGYQLSFIQTGEFVTVDFSDVRLEMQLINYSHGNTWSGSPWQHISDSLNVIEHKKDVLGLTFLNEKEKTILPLCGFSPLHNFDNRYQSISGDKAADKMFIDFAVRAGNDQVTEMTRLYSDAQFKEKKKAQKTLLEELTKPSSEALARLIMSEIKDAAAEYPAEVELDIEPEVLTKSRETVTNIMKQRGYEGEFPHFKKMSSLKGVKLLEVQGQPVFIFNEKHMACMIDYFESSMNFEKLGIDCTVSTVFLKKDELDLFDSLDGRSGFFPHKHRRRARTLAPNFDFRDDDILSYDLESSVIAAAKTAECEKLTEEERSKYFAIGPRKIGCLFFVIFFVFSGLGFGLLFCPAMFLLALIIGAPITAISPEAPSFSEYFASLLFDFPWLSMFLFCFIGFGFLFGLSMTIFTVLSRKRG